MIRFFPKTNMFDHWGNLQCPIIPTNLTPYANAGIAAEIRKHIPSDEFDYMHNKLRMGGLMQFSDGKIAWDLPTKRTLEPGRKSDMVLIHNGLIVLASTGVDRLKRLGIEVILLPKIGSGLGGLNWPDVWKSIFPVIDSMATEIDIAVYSERLSHDGRPF